MNSIKLLILLKETYGYDGDDICHIMNRPERFNDSKTNLAISKLAYALIKGSELSNPKSNFMSDDELFKIMDSIHDDLGDVTQDALKDSFSDLAILEIKKISGTNKSDDSETRKHSQENAKFLSDQIRFLNPNIIICGGKVAWESLTLDMNIFEKGTFQSNVRGIYKANGIIIYNSYHPSSTYFNRYDIMFDISKNINSALANQ